MTNLEQTFLESATRYLRESQSKEIDWEHRRYEIAKDILAGVLSNSDKCMYQGTAGSLTKYAVEFVDTLIEELKKK